MSGNAWIFMSRLKGGWRIAGTAWPCDDGIDMEFRGSSADWGLPVPAWLPLSGNMEVFQEGGVTVSIVNSQDGWMASGRPVHSSLLRLLIRGESGEKSIPIFEGNKISLMSIANRKIRVPCPSGQNIRACSEDGRLLWGRDGTLSVFPGARKWEMIPAVPSGRPARLEDLIIFTCPGGSGRDDAIRLHIRPVYRVLPQENGTPRRLSYAALVRMAGRSRASPGRGEPLRLRVVKGGKIWCESRSLPVAVVPAVSVEIVADMRDHPSGDLRGRHPRDHHAANTIRSCSS